MTFFFFKYLVSVHINLLLYCLPPKSSCPPFTYIYPVNRSEYTGYVYSKL